LKIIEEANSNAGCWSKRGKIKMISLLKLKRQNANAGKKGKLSTCTVHYSYSYKYFLKYPDIVHRAGVH
jgi:hypothetical protein